MLKHDERPASALAHGPAKPDDIERVRRDVEAAETREPRVERAIGEMEAACETIRGDLRELKRTIVSEKQTAAGRGGSAGPRGD
jgi:hypothetical protein